MITLQQLISLAPFEEEVKKELLEKVDTFDDGKKLELTDMCWEYISKWNQNEIRNRYEMAVLEMAEGKKEYTKEELDKIPDDVFNEFMNQLQDVATEKDIEEVREKLEDITAKTKQQQ